MRRNLFWISIGLTVLVLIVAACSSATPPTPVVQEVTREVQVEVTKVVEVQVTVEPPGGVPFQDLWLGSAHADSKAEAFNHWNTASPAEVPTSCARCHSTTGFQDFLGADGSAAGTVEKAAAIGQVVQCVACHNTATVSLTSVTFPSGAEIKNLGPEARCMECHQGRASGKSVDDAITKAGLKDDDTVSSDLGFTNIHYFAAAATVYGTLSKGGYQYPGQTYDGKLAHVDGYNTCVGCHDPHTLKVKVDQCAACHKDVKTIDDVRNIRMQGSLVDYNGNGNTTEGIKAEMDGLRDMLLKAIQGYAKDVAGAPIAYDAKSYPYFFADTNGNGTVDADEAKADNAYKNWTGRLAKAAYNYQVSIKDPGAYAHGGKYIIELMYDSINDLNSKLATKVDLSKAHRIDAGHFAGSQEAFRHWDADFVVPGSCAKCHAPGGLPQFIKEGVAISQLPGNGLQCSTCHNDLTKFTRYTVDSAKFPSGAVLTFGKGDDANLCITCHQGRESTISVNNALKGLPADKVSDKIAFRNIHYFAAGATLFGDDAKGAYEYANKKYVGRNMHTDKANTCTACHDVHALDVKVDKCNACHDVKTQDDLKNIRSDKDTTDWNGDGDVKQGVYFEIDSFRKALYEAIQAKAEKNGTPIVYNPAAYPYFFVDANKDGKPDTNDKGAIGYNAWTPRLLEAAYNYQYSIKDPGGFAHNPKYVLEILYDSIQDLNPAGVAKFKRP